MFKSIVFLYLIHVSSNVFSQSVTKNTFYFDNNQYELSMEQRLKLKELIDTMDKSQFIQILGYANKLGDADKNLILSQKRAEAIREFFITNNLIESKIELRYFGENYALDNPSSIIESRRVDFILSKNNNEIYNPFNPVDAPEIFQIDATYDTTIVCKNGTKIFIKAGSLINLSTGEVSEKATIKVQEYISMTDIIEKGLTTRSDGRMLESGGMINLEAMDNNQVLTLRRGRDVKVSIPCRDCKPGMQTFVGEKQRGTINWKETNNKPGKIESRRTNPIFAEGNESVSHFVNQTKRYPTKAFEKNIEGIVQVKFLIDENGYIQESTIVKSVEASLDKEALYVVSKMPRWTPAKIDGQPVESIYNLPIKFKINREPFGKYQFSSLGDDIEYAADKAMDSIQRQIENQNLLAKKQEMQTVVDLGYYVITSSKLGWINCDRFISGPFVNFIVDANTIENVKVYLIVKSQKSIFNNEARFNSKFNFRQIADNQDVYVLAVKSENGQMYVALHESNTANKSILIENYKESTLAELKQIVDKLKLN
jgi:TonB family protein